MTDTTRMLERKLEALERKYQFLLSLFEVQSVDYWEKDALLVCRSTPHYFQFSCEENARDKDKAVEFLVGGI